jgi:hypothetical protein
VGDREEEPEQGCSGYLWGGENLERFAVLLPFRVSGLLGADFDRSGIALAVEVSAQ